MSELQGFPFLSQLTEFTTDNMPSEDAQYLCVPTSIAAGVMYLTGKHLSPDAMKDEMYGQGTVTTTSADAFVGICDRNGVRLYPRSGPDLVTIAHEELSKGHPVVFTQQDDYAPPQYQSSWSHVCVFFKDAPGQLTCMDPYGGKALTYSDATWHQRMDPWDNKVWILARKDDEMINITDPWVAGFFQDIGNGQWKCKQNGQVIGGNILKYWRVMQGGPRLPQTNELKTSNGVVYQKFESGFIVFDPNKILDKPTMPNGYGCYLLKVESDLAKQLLSQPLLDQIASLKSQNDTLNQQLASTQNADKAQLIAQNQQLAAQVTTYANNMKAINAKAAPFEPKQ